MSLVVSLESVKGSGTVGDRVARVIFRGRREGGGIFDLSIVISGVSKVSRVFEQHNQLSVIGEVGKVLVGDASNISYFL